jgi:hypothetical protein
VASEKADSPNSAATSARTARSSRIGFTLRGPSFSRRLAPLCPLVVSEHSLCAITGRLSRKRSFLYPKHEPRLRHCRSHQEAPHSRALMRGIGRQPSKLRLLAVPRSPSLPISLGTPCFEEASNGIIEKTSRVAIARLGAEAAPRTGTTIVRTLRPLNWDVCFTPKSRHLQCNSACLLCAKSGHSLWTGPIASSRNATALRPREAAN